MWAPGLALRQKINKTARADGADASSSAAAAAAAAAAAPQSFGSRGYSLVFQKYRVRFQKPQEWQNPRENPNRIKYQSCAGVWVNDTVKKIPKKSWFWCGFGGWGLNCHIHPTSVFPKFVSPMYRCSAW